MTINKALSLVLGLVVSGGLSASELPQQSAVPGGVTVIPLGSAGSSAPVAKFGKNRVMVLDHNGQWVAVVGISLNTPPGEQTLQVITRAGQSKSLTFPVGATEYEIQRITLKNPRMVTPRKEDLPRISKEWKRSRAALTAWSDVAEGAFPLDLPVKGRRSSSFGLRRIFNGQARRPHSGIDIAAPAGTPVRAPASGRVVEAGNFYFNGNTLFLDHGKGLVTMYCHLSSVKVAVGQEVARGETIATVGSTGRATGPHLHWTVSLNGVAVDPALLLSRPTATLATAAKTE